MRRVKGQKVPDEVKQTISQQTVSGRPASEPLQNESTTFIASGPAILDD